VTDANGIPVATGSIGSFDLVVNSGPSYTPPTGVLSLGAPGGKILGSVIAGSIQKGSISVRVTNGSTSPVTGAVAVTLYESSTPYNDNLIPAFSVAAEPAVSTKVKNLKPGKSFVVHFKPFTYSTAGTEYLVAEAQLNGRVNSEDSASPAITVAQAYVDARALSAGLGKPRIAAGVSFPVTLSLQNTGNTSIKNASASVTVSLAPVGGASSTTIASAVPLHLSLQPGQIKKFPIKFRPKTLPASGAYQLTLTLILSGDTDSTDKIVTAIGTVTV
jgi:hypothetical protein